MGVFYLSTPRTYLIDIKYSPLLTIIIRKPYKKNKARIEGVHTYNTYGHLVLVGELHPPIKTYVLCQTIC